MFGENSDDAELFRIVGHALRAPIGRIFQAADLILSGVEGEVNPQVRADVVEMRASAESSLTVLNKILELVRVTGSVNDCQPVAVNYRTVLRRACDEVQKLADGLECSIALDVAENLPLVTFTHGTDLQLVIQIALTNVLIRSPRSGGVIYLRVCVEDGFAVTSIANNRLSTSQAKLNIGEFLRAEKSAALSLDVQIARTLLQKVVGQLWLTSKSTFRDVAWHFSLPIINETNGITPHW